MNYKLIINKNLADLSAVNAPVLTAKFRLLLATVFKHSTLYDVISCKIGMETLNGISRFPASQRRCGSFSSFYFRFYPI